MASKRSRYEHSRSKEWRNSTPTCSEYVGSSLRNEWVLRLFLRTRSLDAIRLGVAYRIRHRYPKMWIGATENNSFRRSQFLTSATYFRCETTIHTKYPWREAANSLFPLRDFTCSSKTVTCNESDLYRLDWGIEKNWEMKIIWKRNLNL